MLWTTEEKRVLRNLIKGDVDEALKAGITLDQEHGIGIAGVDEKYLVSPTKRLTDQIMHHIYYHERLQMHQLNRII